MKRINLFVVSIICIVSISCVGKPPTVYPEVERTKEFDEIYYVLLDYFETEKGELSDYCIWFTRDTIIEWRDHPNKIGHAGSKPAKKWSRIILDDRLRGWQFITVILHEMIHLIYWCHIPQDEWTEKSHGDSTVWANGGGDFDITKFCKDISVEIGNIKKDSVLFKAAYELVCLDHDALIEWAKTEDVISDMRVQENNSSQ